VWDWDVFRGHVVGVCSGVVGIDPRTLYTSPPRATARLWRAMTHSPHASPMYPSGFLAPIRFGTPWVLKSSVVLERPAVMLPNVHPTRMCAPLPRVPLPRRRTRQCRWCICIVLSDFIYMCVVRWCGAERAWIDFMADRDQIAEQSWFNYDRWLQVLRDAGENITADEEVRLRAIAYPLCVTKCCMADDTVINVLWVLLPSLCDCVNGRRRR